MADRSNESFFWSIVDAAPDGIIVVDGDGRIRMINQQAEVMFGYSRRDLIDQFVETLLPPASRDHHRIHRDHYIEKPRVRPMGAGLDLCAQRADGTTFPVEISLSPIRSGGDVFVVAAIRDITARVAAEQHLRETEEALQEAARALAISDDRERIARELHDTVIQRLFAAGLALEGVASRVDGDIAERIEEVVGQLDETIREIRMAIFSLQHVRRSGSGLRGRLLEVITGQGQALGFEPRLQFEGPIETIDAAVADHLIPTLREALANVARHARARNVRVIVHATGNEVGLEVSDDGVGVPADVVGGRGLSNMADRARALGGSFEVQAHEGGGTILRWRVPASLVSA